MRARHDAVEETRRAITEATMNLHERVGPRETTVSAIAAAAHVTRLTVYRHFPDDEALVLACSAHWRALHPRPDLAHWKHIKDPVLRLQTALAETYRWAAAAAPMMRMIHRDVDSMPPFVSSYLAADERARVAALAVGFGARGRASRRLQAALAHALHINTWNSLCTDGGLTDSEAVDVMVGGVLAAIGPPQSRRG
jgi:AcrR family transcriptional regulator